MADIEEVARRIVEGIEASAGIGRDDTDDARSIRARWHELIGWPAYSSEIDQARQQARVEFVAGILASLAMPTNWEGGTIEVDGMDDIITGFEDFPICGNRRQFIISYKPKVSGQGGAVVIRLKLPGQS